MPAAGSIGFLAIAILVGWAFDRFRLQERQRLEIQTELDEAKTRCFTPECRQPSRTLTNPVRLLLASLSPGAFKIKFDTGNEQYAIRLDKIEPVMTEKDQAPDREEIRLLLSEYRGEQIINEWYGDLRNQASITIHNKNN